LKKNNITYVDVRRHADGMRIALYLLDLSRIQETYMASELENVGHEAKVPAFNSSLTQGNPEAGETRLLMEAFEMFTHASSSLESAFSRLQAKAQRLTDELEAKNLELERSLREKEEAQNYLRTILERLPCGVFVLDGKGDLALCNPMASEVLSQSSCKASGIGNRRRPFLSAEMRNYLSASASEGGANSEVEIPFTSGNKKGIVATSGTPLTDASGSGIGTLHIIRDITEVKALQEKNKRIERLSAMGEMAVELAHEIRNPLGSIELFASLLVKELSGDPGRWAENIRIGIRSLNTIVSNMLHFANPLSPVFSDVSVHEVIQEIVKFCDPLMSQRQVHLETDLGANSHVIPADRELLRQMMLNLIFNAMKAMPSQGSLFITTRNAELKDGNHRGLELRIRDTGFGIPPENLSRIFDPFFTTNKNGTGLGLSIVHQIVEKHSGLISVASEINRGTTFTIVFGLMPEKE
jgi:nitrogen fixation/metabolism regulation signal transduction histidine kinase